MTSSTPSPTPPELLAALERSQELGFLGPGPVETHVIHSLGFASSPAVAPPARFLDLGSGGGVPGVVLALLAWPSSSAVLLDASERRCAFLEDEVASLSLADRVSVVRARAEEAGRNAALRGMFELVVARSFASPPVTAECAAPLLRVGGHLVVSEPPSSIRDASRWPADPLAELGLEPSTRWTTPYAYQSLTQSSPCPTRYPRRVGVPAKRPLF
jgi:16S rRNA (guanine527-N7)-methyltransferase